MRDDGVGAGDVETYECTMSDALSKLPCLGTTHHSPIRREACVRTDTQLETAIKDERGLNKQSNNNNNNNNNNHHHQLTLHFLDMLPNLSFFQRFLLKDATCCLRERERE